MQGDGDLVLHKRDLQSQYSIVKWTSNSGGQGTPPYRLVMQPDNNLVLYGGGPLWNAQTYNQGAAGAKAKLNDNGNFAVYDGNGVELWSTNTAGSGTKIKLEGSVIMGSLPFVYLWNTAYNGMPTIFSGDDLVLQFVQPQVQPQSHQHLRQ